MSWIKLANKNGKYQYTYLGFRVYKTQFETIAINKQGVKFTGKLFDEYVSKIDIYYLENVVYKK
ncbi:hypothetical protein [Limnovirga soli]|uniref:Uncharacterized protein n=1 Tax=Limnovirga soli TaxID=2656915 RepID=A0A8J8FD89_9BACT|nr:hypothetical protein [Limnovirga soli]NNV54547.1 hypothetical protein [Limnovirga soli]